MSAAYMTFWTRRLMVIVWVVGRCWRFACGRGVIPVGSDPAQIAAAFGLRKLEPERQWEVEVLCESRHGI